MPQGFGFRCFTRQTVEVWHVFLLRFDLETIMWLWSLDWSRCLSLGKIKRFRINLCNKPWVFCLQVGWNLKFMRCLHTCQCYINFLTKAWLLDYHVKRGMILLSTCSMAILECSPCYLGMPSLPMACLINRKLSLGVSQGSTNCSTMFLKYLWFHLVCWRVNAMNYQTWVGRSYLG